VDDIPYILISKHVLTATLMPPTPLHQVNSQVYMHLLTLCCLVTVGLCAHQSISIVCYWAGQSTLFHCAHNHIHCEAISFIT